MVHLDLRCVGGERCCTVEVGSGAVEVFLLELDKAEVVESAEVVGVDACGCFVDLDLAGGILGESCSVEEFIDSECGGIGVDGTVDFIVALADDVDRSCDT